MSDVFAATPPDLLTPRLRLRALSVADASAVFAYASVPAVARFTLWAPHRSEAFTQGFIKALTQPAFLNWAITRPPSDEAMGMIFLHSFSKAHQKAEIAFNLAEGSWGQGLATEAGRAVLPFAFGPLQLHRVEATCMPENVASRRVLEKLGMAYEGRMRQSHRRHDGFHDMDLFAAVASP